MSGLLMFFFHVDPGFESTCEGLVGIVFTEHGPQEAQMHQIHQKGLCHGFEIVPVEGSVEALNDESQDGDCSAANEVLIGFGALGEDHGPGVETSQERSLTKTQNGQDKDRLGDVRKGAGFIESLQVHDLVVQGFKSDQSHERREYKTTRLSD